MSEIKNVIFDVGEVFVVWNPHVFFSKYFKTADEVNAFMKEINFEYANHLADTGVPVTELMNNIARKFPKYSEIVLAYDREWINAIVAEVEGTVDLMLDLKKSGYKAYGLSNFELDKFNVLRKKYPFADHFDGLIVSGEVRQIKPYEGIYKTLLSTYKLKAQECVFLDDRQENLDTAQRLGFKTILFKTAVQAKADLEKLEVKVK